jgi:hypothetical protein
MAPAAPRGEVTRTVLDLAETESRLRRLKRIALTTGSYDPLEFDGLLVEHRRLRRTLLRADPRRVAAGRAASVPHAA